MNVLCTDPCLASCKPNNIAMTTLIQCWTESEKEGSTDKARRSFCAMKKKYMDGDKNMAPDCFCYSILMHAFMKECAYENAEALLWEMVDDYLGGNHGAEPRIGQCWICCFQLSVCF
jgi:hypothetical protein